MTRRLHICLAGVLVAALPLGAQTPVGTAFTYQGRLTDGGGSANGSYDFRFTLFDAATGGNPVGSPVTVSSVAVSQGLFTVALDFGATAFQGQARWLGIEVQLSGGGGYTPLDPRQPLTPAPHSVFSSYTDPLNLTNLNASNLISGTLPSARLSGTYSLVLSLTNPANAIAGAFSGNGAALTSLNASSLASGTVPNGVVSGIYANAVTLSNSSNAFSGDGSGLTNLNAQPKYARTVIVSPLGAPAQNGTVLLAALAAITTASATNPWLLKIEPGVFDLGAASLVMKPFVDVEGSGESVTRVTAAGSGSATTGAVSGASNAELRFLTVQNTGGAAYARGIYMDGVATRLSHVTVDVSGATTESDGLFMTNDTSAAVLTDLTVTASGGTGLNYGVSSAGLGAASTIRNLTVTAQGGAESHAVVVSGGAAPLMMDVVAQGSGATTVNRGVSIYASSPTLRRFMAFGFGGASFDDGIASFGTSSALLEQVTASASGAVQNTGIYNGPGTSTSMTDVVAQAAGGNLAWAVNDDSTGVRVTRLTARASGATTENIGVRSYFASETMNDVTASASGGASAVAILVSGSSFTATGVTASALSGTNDYGIRVSAGNLSLQHASVTATGTTTAYGIANEGLGSAHLLYVDTEAGNASGTNAGVLNTNGSALYLESSVAIGSGGNFSNGVRNTGTAGFMEVDTSTLTGSSASVANLAGSTVRVGGSRLLGGFNNSGGGAVTCVGAYNGSTYTPLDVTCQ